MSIKYGTGCRRSFFGADLFFVGVFPAPQLRMKGAGAGNQDEQGGQEAMLQAGRHPFKPPKVWVDAILFRVKWLSANMLRTKNEF